MFVKVRCWPWFHVALMNYPEPPVTLLIGLEPEAH